MRILFLLFQNHPAFVPLVEVTSVMVLENWDLHLTDCLKLVRIEGISILMLVCIWAMI